MAELREETDSKQDGRRAKRIFVRLREDGSPDVENLTSEQRSALRAELNQVDQGEETEEAGPIDPSVCGVVFAGVVQIEALFVAPKFGLSPEQAVEALTPPSGLSDALNAAAAKVLAKHSAIFGQWQDEIALGLLLICWQTAAISAMRLMGEKNNSNEVNVDAGSNHRTAAAGKINVSVSAGDEGAEGAKGDDNYIRSEQSIRAI